MCADKQVPDAVGEEEVRWMDGGELWQEGGRNRDCDVTGGRHAALIVHIPAGNDKGFLLAPSLMTSLDAVCSSCSFGYSFMNDVTGEMNFDLRVVAKNIVMENALVHPRANEDGY